MGPVMMTANGPASSGRNLASGDLTGYPAPSSGPSPAPAAASADAPFDLADPDNDPAEDDTLSKGDTTGPGFAALHIPAPLPGLAALSFGIPLAQPLSVAPEDQAVPKTGETAAMAPASAPSSPDARTDLGPTSQPVPGPPAKLAPADVATSPASPPTPRNAGETPPFTPTQTRTDPPTPLPVAADTTGTLAGSTLTAPMIKISAPVDPGADATAMGSTDTAPAAPDTQAKPAPRPGQQGAGEGGVSAPPGTTAHGTAPDEAAPGETDNGADRATPQDLSPADAGRQETRSSESSRSSGLKSETPALSRHVSAQMTSAIRHGHDGMVEIALNPEELGQVRLSLQGDATRLHVAIQFERAETQDLMRRHIAQLEGDFQDLGYTQISFDFGQAPSDRGTGLPVQPPPGSDPTPDALTDTGPAAAPRRAAALAAVATAPGGLDLRL